MIAAQPLFQLGWQKYREQKLAIIYPLEINHFWQNQDNGPKILGNFTQTDPTVPIVIDQALDYGNLDNWFSGHLSAAQTTQSYSLDIDKLGIKNALVKVGGNNIDNNLVQFNTAPQIGGIGTPVIFGHSTLRQFYNPKETNKSRYKSIFSTIMTLENGDLIKVRLGDLIYSYKVIEKKEVQPDDDYILAQREGAKLLKLVTCTPEGTFLHRGIITAELIE